MSKLKESDFNYGAVLSTLLNNNICPALIEGGEDRQVYDFTTDHKDFRLFVKYRSAPTTKSERYSSWTFVFSKGEIEEIESYLEMDKLLVLGLVCGSEGFKESHYAVLGAEEIKQILSLEKNSITIGKEKRTQHYKVYVDRTRKNALQVKSNRLY